MYSTEHGGTLSSGFRSSSVLIVKIKIFRIPATFDTAHLYVYASIIKKEMMWKISYYQLNYQINSLSSLCVHLPQNSLVFYFN